MNKPRGPLSLKTANMGNPGYNAQVALPHSLRADTPLEWIEPRFKAIYEQGLIIEAERAWAIAEFDAERERLRNSQR